MVILVLLLLQSAEAQFEKFSPRPGPLKQFYISEDFRANEQNALHDLQTVFKYISEHTCIRFQEIDDKNSNTKISRVPPEWSCAAHIHEMWLGAGGCRGVMVTLHEVHHWLGMFHSQDRSDGDDFLSFKAGTGAIPGKRVNSDNVVPFDYGSVLLYTPGRKCDTTGMCHSYEVKDFKNYYTSRLPYIEQFYDVYALNLFYCNGTCSGEASPNCQNGGYPNPSKCSECLCPRGFAGLDCTQPAGGKVYVANAEFQKELISRNGPFHINRVQSFDWIIAPQGKHIEYRISQTERPYGHYVEVFANPDIRQSPYVHYGDKDRYKAQTPGDQERAQEATKSGIYAGNVLRVSVLCEAPYLLKFTESFIEFRYVDGDHTNKYVLSNVSATAKPSPYISSA